MESLQLHQWMYLQLLNQNAGFQDEIKYSQSSQPRDRVMLILVYTRSMTKKHIRAEDIASPVITAFPQDSGSTKFGKIPGGGCAAGISARSTAESVGRLMILEEISQIEAELESWLGSQFFEQESDCFDCHRLYMYFLENNQVHYFL